MLGLIGGVSLVVQPFVIAELRLSYETREAVFLGFGMTYPIIAFALLGLWLLERLRLAASYRPIRGRSGADPKQRQWIQRANGQNWPERTRNLDDPGLPLS